ncbi:hypothetical protein LguiA_028459 [Lonicera macranthoides]
MQLPHQHSRINLAELKAQMVWKLGQDRSKEYFNYLNRFLSLKLNKIEFSKLSLRIVGRLNLPLHNEFISSILKNACTAKMPSPSDSTGIRDWKVRVHKDHRNVLELNGKTNFASQQSSITHSCNFNVVSYNGYSSPANNHSPVQHYQGLTQQGENKGEFLGNGDHPAKFPVIQRSPGRPVSLHRKDHNELLVREDGKEVFARSLLHAPLGIPICAPSARGSYRALPLASSSRCASSFISGGLLDSITLREQMEQIAAAQSLEGVSMDCANAVNNRLDAYLKCLIRSCVELVGARSYNEPKNITQKHGVKLVNGFRPGHHHHQMQSTSRPSEIMQEHRSHCPISLLDFRVAMELNLKQLGEYWPLLLEKICTHAFEE